MIQPTQQQLQANVFLSLSVICGPISCFLLNTPFQFIFFAAVMVFLVLGIVSYLIEPFIKWDHLKTMCQLKIAWVISCVLYMVRMLFAEDPVILWSSVAMMILCFLPLIGVILAIKEYKESQEKSCIDT